MKKSPLEMKPNAPASATELRRHAEQRLHAQMPPDKAPPLADDTQRLLHELQVHRVELEMQNEELLEARAQAEALAASYADLYEFAPVSYFTLGPEGEITQSNLAGARLLGCDRGRLLGQRFGSFVSETDRPAFNAHIQQVFADQLQRTCEVGLSKKGEALTMVRMESALSPEGHQCRAVVVDISESKRAEQALRNSAYVRSLIEASLDPLVTISPAGRITDVNEASSQATGIPREQLIGTDFLDYFTDPARAREGYQKVFSEGFVRDYPLAIRHTSGRVTEVLYNASVYRDAHGQVQGVFAAARDITERKRAEKEKEILEASNRQLQKAESLGRMAGAIAHLFNNQLQGVMLNLEMAESALPQGTGVVESLTEAMKAARKAAEVNSLMLTYLGQTTAKHELLDLSEACLRSLPLMRAAMPKSAVLETDFPSPGPAISANANQMQQVLINLVTNAWEALGDEPGAVHLRVKTVSAADIPASNRFPLDWAPQEDAYACLEVVDAGCGIASADIEKLFDPFFSSKFTGRGLGLPVVLGVVRAHCGAITVESEPGRGSVFRVFLPASAEAAPQRPAQVVRAPLPGVGGTVLVVEDELVVRKSVTLALKRLGFTVLAAGDGAEAVAMFREHRHEICLVLCDLTMPRMNGWETLTALRQLQPGIPIILSSGYSEGQVTEGDHPELPQAILSKPYQFRALCDAIRCVLGASRG